MPAVRVLCLALAFGISLVSCVIELAPGYQEVRQTWNDLTGKPLEEVQQFLTVDLPGVEFRVFHLMDMPAEFYFNMIKIVVDDDNNVILPPKFFGHEPNFSLFEDLVGKTFTEAENILKAVIKEMIVVKKGELVASMSPGSSPSSGNYILLNIDDDSKVIEPPRYVRVLSSNDSDRPTRTTDDAEELVEVTEPEIVEPKSEITEPETEVVVEPEPEVGDDSALSQE